MVCFDNFSSTKQIEFLLFFLVIIKCNVMSVSLLEYLWFNSLFPEIWYSEQDIRLHFQLQRKIMPSFTFHMTLTINICKKKIWLLLWVSYSWIIPIWWFNSTTMLFSEVVLLRHISLLGISRVSISYFLHVTFCPFSLLIWKNISSL